MKTLPLLVLVLAGTAVLADPGWIRRAPLEADKRAYGMFTSPDGITVDYIVHHGGRLGELHFYDVNEFFYVKSVSSKDHESALTALTESIVSSNSAELANDVEFSMTPTVAGSKLIVTDTVSGYQIGTGSLDYDERVIIGKVRYSLLIDIETNTLEASHAFWVPFEQSSPPATTIAYQDGDSTIIFYYGDCNQEDSPQCEGWYAFVELNPSGSSFVAGGDYTETSAVQRPMPTSAFRYDVERDPLESMEDWGNPRAVVWVTGFSQDITAEPELMVSTPFVVCFTVDSAGQASLQWVRNLPDAVQAMDQDWLDQAEAADTSDGFMLSFTTRSKEEQNNGIELWLLRKTLDPDELVADNRAFYSEPGPKDTNWYSDRPVLTGSLGSNDLVYFLPGRTSWDYNEVKTVKGAAVTVSVIDGAITISNYNGLNCQKASVTSFQEPNGCTHLANVPIYVQGTVTRWFKGLNQWGTLPSENGRDVAKICTEETCQLFMYDPGEKSWSTLEWDSDVFAVGGLGLGAVFGLAGATAYTGRAKSKKLKRKVPVAKTTPSPTEDEKIPDEAVGEITLPAMMVGPDGNITPAHEASGGSKGSRGSNQDKAVDSETDLKTSKSSIGSKTKKKRRTSSMSKKKRRSSSTSKKKRRRSRSPSATRKSRGAEAKLRTSSGAKGRKSPGTKRPVPNGGSSGGSLRSKGSQGSVRSKGSQGSVRSKGSQGKSSQPNALGSSES